MPDKELILEGNLESIPEIRSLTKKESDSHETFDGTLTILKIRGKDDLDLHEIKYHASTSLLADSINNRVEVYKDNKRRIIIYDTKLDRWYL